MHAVDERRSCRPRAARPPTRQAGAGDADRSAQGVLRGRRRVRREAGQERRIERASVDRDADAAEEREPERAAELGAGLADPDAAPARSGGADPTISSVVSPNTGARPSEMITEAITSWTSPSVVGTRASRNRPSDPNARPPLIRYAGLTRWTIRGAACEPTMNPIAEGSDSRPAWNGVRPATSCRYWATNRK